MSGFAPGDVVVKIDRALNRCPNRDGHARARARFGDGGLSNGRAYTVHAVMRGGNCELHLLLREVRTSNPAGYCAGVFRKIDPATDEFTADMRALKPVRDAALAPTGLTFSEAVGLGIL